jgi:hypothetical protein
MLNTTGRILNVRLLRGWNFALPPTSYAARVKYEDETWKAFAERVASRGVDEQIPARSEGRSNIHIETEPLDAARLDDITNRKLVLYFYNIFQDRKTKEHLVEICVYLNPDLSVQDCANHNKP